MRVQGVRLALAAAVLAGAAAALGGCAGLPATTEATAATDTRAAARAPRGPCAAPIAEFEDIIENDRKIGHLNGMVHSRITAELAGVKADCAAGRTREANGKLAALRSRYGYR